MSADREREIPQLVIDGYEVTSDETPDYNCIAWAAGDDKRKWDIDPRFFWPIPSRGGMVDDLRDVFVSLGFEQCGDDVLESGYEKVAIYCDASLNWTHASKQLPSGEWSSKLGDWQDIRHRSAYSVCCSDYGSVFYFMRRAIAGSRQ